MDISSQNPWWNEGGLWQDRDLSRVKISPLHYRPDVISRKDLGAGNVLTLRGPRRVGKTVTLKLLVADLIDTRKVAPREILWLSLDTVRTLQQMEDLLVRYLKEMPPRFLFIDEATSVMGWQRVIKQLVDTGALSEVCTVVTGSSAYDLKRGSERMAGRKGTVVNPDRVLLPMGYGDFLRQVPFSERKNLSTYLQIGGFPFRIEQFIESKGVLKPTESLSTLDDVYFYEINRRKLDRNLALEILRRLSEIQNHAVSYESLAKPLSAAKDTVRNYLNALGDSFLLATIYSFDTARNRVSAKKDKKFVWVDPSLSYLAPVLEQGEESSEAARAEWALGIELLRRYEVRLWEGLSAPRNVFTWKSSSGNEIDYLIVQRGSKRMIPFELKYQHLIADWDFQVMERAFQQGYLLTRETRRSRAKSAALPLGEFLQEASPVGSPLALRKSY